MLAILVLTVLQDIITLRPTPVVAFDVMPEELSPFFVQISLPPIIVNHEATVKDTINVLIQWVAKHQPKSANQYAIASSASTPLLSTAPTAALPPLPISPPSDRKVSRRATKAILPNPATTAPRMRVSPIFPPPPPLPGTGPHVSIISMPSFQTPYQPTTSGAIVRSASADSATGLGGSIVAAVPRTISNTSHVAPNNTFTAMRSPTTQRKANSSFSTSAPNDQGKHMLARGARSTSSSSLPVSDFPAGTNPAPTTTTQPLTSVPSMLIPIPTLPTQTPDQTLTTPRESPRDTSSRDSSPRAYRSAASPRNRIVVAASSLTSNNSGSEPYSSASLRRGSAGSLGVAGGRGVQRATRPNPELLPTLGITPPPIFGANLGLMLRIFFL